MRFNDSVLLDYMSMAPLALAFERSLECKIYQQLQLPHPILDLGCGEGLFSKILFTEKIDTGIDPDPRELERARQLGAYQELIQCIGSSVPKPNGFYYTIFSNSVLEHIPDLTPVLKEVNRLLALGGRFYITVPSNDFDKHSVIRRLLMKVGLPKIAERFGILYNKFWKHYHYYTKEDWEELVCHFGFEIVESFYYDPRKVCTLNDSLVPFGLLSLVIKRLTNRWVLFPTLRRIVIYPFFILAERFLQGAEKSNQGGLVFISLTKVDA